MADTVRWASLRTFLRRLPWYRFGAGVIGGGAGLIVTFLMRSFGLGVFLPEIAVDFVVGRIPGEIESVFIRSLGEGAKVLALITAVGVFLVLPAVYATLFRRVQAWLKGRWYVMGFYTLSSAGIVLLGILPVLGAGVLGSNTFAGAGFASLSQLLGYWIYAAVLDYLLIDVAANHPEGFQLSRRQFIVGSVAAIASVALAFYGLTSLAMKKGRLAFASLADLLAHEVTPTSEFYVVTKNVFDPMVNARDDTVDPGPWRLTIGGLVSNPRAYTYPELLGLAATDEFVTLECVSNEVGGNLISTAEWIGVPLASLLQSAGVEAAADWIVFTCADDYTAGIPTGKAIDPATLVAVKMNGDPLTPAHGFPARIIVPGLYGMFHAKWLTRIDAVQGEFRGFWQQKGWTNSDDGHGQIHTTAIITTPPDGTVVGSAVTIAGVAFAGDRGISAVKVSTDGGQNWADAALTLPPKSGLTWVLWRFPWSPPPGSGSVRIVAYAIDGTGTSQDAAPRSPFPDGAAGYDSITLLVP